MVVTVFSAILTWTHVVVVLRVLIVETGISMMELLDCHSLFHRHATTIVGIIVCAVLY